jgi:hypothetical protein
MMILLTLLVAACGGDDDNNDATETATTGAGVVTEASTDEAVETATTEVTVASAAESSPISTVFAEAGASPAATPASVIATPAAIASPVTAASPAAATPETGSAAVVAAAAVGDDPGATPGAATDLTLSGRVVLPGGANEAWVITDDGCVGLGTHGDMKAGRQLVVRDAEGAIIGVSMLEDSGETDTCAWTFALDVPESPFYAVSIPMVVEHIFTQQEVEQNNGAVVVPIG